MSAELAVATPLAVPRGAVRRNLVLLALVGLPFTYALTLNLRFPFKLYELALALALVTCLLDLRLTLPPGIRPVVRLLVDGLVITVPLVW